jgi:hypothetical protein
MTGCHRQLWCKTASRLFSFCFYTSLRSATQKTPLLVVCFAIARVHPVGMASQAVQTMAAHIRGEKVEPKIATPEALATPENMNDPAIQKLLYPELLD